MGGSEAPAAAASTGASDTANTRRSAASTATDAIVGSVTRGVVW